MDYFSNVCLQPQADKLLFTEEVLQNGEKERLMSQGPCRRVESLLVHSHILFTRSDLKQRKLAATLCWHQNVDVSSSLSLSAVLFPSVVSSSGFICLAFCRLLLTSLFVSLWLSFCSVSINPRPALFPPPRPPQPQCAVSLNYRGVEQVCSWPAIDAD